MAECTDDRLRLLMERIDRLEDEKKAIGQDVSAVYAEAKAVGYDVKVMRALRKLLKMKPDDRREMDMLLDTYKAALGIESYTQADMFAEHDGRPNPKMPAAAPSDKFDDLYVKALELVTTHKTPSVSWLQRQLGIGWNMASKILERMEANEIVSAPNHVGRRELLVPSVAGDIARMKANLAAKGITMSIEIPDDGRPRLTLVADDEGATQ